MRSRVGKVTKERDLRKSGLPAGPSFPKGVHNGHFVL